ncbi:MAG TPA: lipid II flippase MurJ [Bryobacteraceae bacterium]|nr:lipid II flippase MurJ [Bryobacteraceae bacterium]
MFSLRPRAVSWRVLLQMATVGASTGLVKVTAAAKVIVTARAFGTSDGLDAYLIAFLLPAFVCDTLAGALTSSLIPTFIEVRAIQGREAAERLYRGVLAAGLGLLTVAAMIVGAFAPWIFRVLAVSFDANKIALTSSLFWVMLLSIPLSALATCWRAILNTEGRFALPAMLPALTPLLSIAFLLAFGRTWGVYTLALGTLAGAAAETALLAVLMSRHGFPILPRWYGRDAALDQVMAQYAPLIASVLLVGGTPLIDQSIAATLGSGSVAALNYGTRLAAVLIAMGPAAVATAILPHFSRLTVSEDWTHIRRSLRGYAAVIVSSALPLVAVLVLFSEPMVRLFFERGQFTGAATELVTRVQRFSLLQIPAALVLALVLRFISSVKANRLLVRVVGWYAVSNVGLDFALARWMGVAGIPLATALVQLGALVYLLRLLRTHLPRLVPAAARAAA